MAAWNPYMPSWWQSALLTSPNPEDEWPVASPPPASGFEFPAAGPLPLPSTSLPDVDNPRQDFSDVMWMGLPVQPLMDKKNGWLNPETDSLFARIQDLPGAQPPTLWPDPATSMPGNLPQPRLFPATGELVSMDAEPAVPITESVAGPGAAIAKPVRTSGFTSSEAVDVSAR